MKKLAIVIVFVATACFIPQANFKDPDTIEQLEMIKRGIITYKQKLAQIHHALGNLIDTAQNQAPELPPRDHEEPSFDPPPPPTDGPPPPTPGSPSGPPVPPTDGPPPPTPDGQGPPIPPTGDQPGPSKQPSGDQTAPPLPPRDLFPKASQEPFALTLADKSFDDLKKPSFTQAEVDIWIKETITQDKPFANLSSEYSVTMMQRAEERLEKIARFLSDSFTLEDALEELKGQDLENLAPIVITKILNVKDVKEALDNDDMFETLLSKVSEAKEKLSGLAKSITDPKKNNIAPSLSFFGFYFFMQPQEYDSKALNACFSLVDENMKANSFEVITTAWQYWLNGLDAESLNALVVGLKINEVLSENTSPLYKELKIIFDQITQRRNIQISPSDKKSLDVLATQIKSILSNYSSKSKSAGNYIFAEISKLFVSTPMIKLAPIMFLITLSWEDLADILRNLIENRLLSKTSVETLIKKKVDKITTDGIVSQLYKNYLVPLIQLHSPSFTFDYQSFANTILEVIATAKLETTTTKPKQDEGISASELYRYKVDFKQIMKVASSSQSKIDKFKINNKKLIYKFLDLSAREWLDITTEERNITTFKKYFVTEQRDIKKLDVTLELIKEHKAKKAKDKENQQTEAEEKKKQKEKEQQLAEKKKLENINNNLTKLFKSITQSPEKYYWKKSLSQKDEALLQSALQHTQSKDKLEELLTNLRKSHNKIFTNVTSYSVSHRMNPLNEIPEVKILIDKVNEKKIDIQPGKPQPPTPRPKPRPLPAPKPLPRDTIDQTAINNYQEYKKTQVDPLVSELTNITSSHPAAKMLSAKSQQITQLTKTLDKKIVEKAPISQTEVDGITKRTDETRELLNAAKNTKSQIDVFNKLDSDYRASDTLKKLIASKDDSALQDLREKIKAAFIVGKKWVAGIQKSTTHTPEKLAKAADFFKNTIDTITKAINQAKESLRKKTPQLPTEKTEKEKIAQLLEERKVLTSKLSKLDENIIKMRLRLGESKTSDKLLQEELLSMKASLEQKQNQLTKDLENQPTTQETAVKNYNKKLSQYIKDINSDLAEAGLFLKSITRAQLPLPEPPKPTTTKKPTKKKTTKKKRRLKPRRRKRPKKIKPLYSTRTQNR